MGKVFEVELDEKRPNVGIVASQYTGMSEMVNILCELT